MCTSHDTWPAHCFICSHQGRSGSPETQRGTCTASPYMGCRWDPRAIGDHSLLRLILICLFFMWVKHCSIPCLCKLLFSGNPNICKPCKGADSLVVLLLMVGSSSRGILPCLLYNNDKIPALFDLPRKLIVQLNEQNINFALDLVEGVSYIFESLRNSYKLKITKSKPKNSKP